MAHYAGNIGKKKDLTKMEQYRKLLILGDIHGRTCWKNIIEKESPDHVVFLGDYVDTHENITHKQQIENFVNILEYKEANPDTVTMLVGNHDLSELYYEFECSGHSSAMSHALSKYKERFVKNTSIIFVYNNIIFSHAGVTKTWMKNTFGEYPHDVNDINNLSIHDISLAFSGSYFSTNPYGDDVWQSPIWVRPNSLLKDAVDDYSQVVGHTSVKKIFNLRSYIDNPESETRDFYLCDNLPYEYLIYTNGKFEAKTFTKDIRVTDYCYLIYVEDNLYKLKIDDGVSIKVYYKNKDSDSIHYIKLNNDFTLKLNDYFAPKGNIDTITYSENNYYVTLTNEK